MSRTRIVCLVAILISLAAAITCYFLANHFPEHIYRSEKLMDSYFGSDLPRTYANMTDRHSSFWATYKHPLYGLVFLPAGYLLRVVFGLSTQATAQLFLGVNMFVWTLTLFACLFFLTKRILDTCLYVALALSTSSVLFWFTVPESFCFGSTTILLPILLAMIPRFSRNYILHVAAQVVSASITLTNWMAGFLSSLFKQGVRRTVQIALHALAVLTILWSVQLKMAPSSTFFMNSPTLAWEAKWWVRDCMSVSIPMKLKYLFFDPVASSPMISHVVPAEKYEVQWGKWPPNDLPRLDVDETAARQPQQSQAVAGLFSIPLHGCYMVLWSFVLAFGIFCLVRQSFKSPALRVIAACLFGQAVLHMLYDVRETFIYSAHWVPLLVLTVATTSKTRFRPYVLGAVALIIVYCGITNVSLYAACLRLLETFSAWAQ